MSKSCSKDDHFEDPLKNTYTVISNLRNPVSATFTLDDSDSENAASYVVKIVDELKLAINKNRKQNAKMSAKTTNEVKSYKKTANGEVYNDFPCECNHPLCCDDSESDEYDDCPIFNYQGIDIKIPTKIEGTRDRLRRRLQQNRERNAEMMAKENGGDKPKQAENAKKQVKAAVTKAENVRKVKSDQKLHEKNRELAQMAFEEQKENLQELNDELHKVEISIKDVLNQLKQLRERDNNQKSFKIGSAEAKLKDLQKQRLKLEKKTKKTFKTMKSLQPGVDLDEECSEMMNVLNLLHPQEKPVKVVNQSKSAASGKKKDLVDTNARPLDVPRSSIQPLQMYTIIDGNFVPVDIKLDSSAIVVPKFYADEKVVNGNAATAEKKEPPSPVMKFIEQAHQNLQQEKASTTEPEHVGINNQALPLDMLFEKSLGYRTLATKEEYEEFPELNRNFFSISHDGTNSAQPMRSEYAPVSNYQPFNNPMNQNVLFNNKAYEDDSVSSSLSYNSSPTSKKSDNDSAIVMNKDGFWTLREALSLPGFSGDNNSHNAIANVTNKASLS